MATHFQEKPHRALLRKALPLLQRIEPRDEGLRALISDVKAALNLYARKGPLRRLPHELLHVVVEILPQSTDAAAAGALVEQIKLLLSVDTETICKLDEN